jgi:hypothetical protein
VKVDVEVILTHMQYKKDHIFNFWRQKKSVSYITERNTQAGIKKLKHMD